MQAGGLQQVKLGAQRVPGVEGDDSGSAPSGKAQAGELQQAEFLCPADRRAAVLNAELAVHGALVGLHGIQRDI